ncbi:dual specificity mitogen-activated protein kinase kinase 7-like [Diorhabda sublineata]|uniref:dual specificity mitogen-activated protein kinase kinase 7-like n=1 Tax=Diorhabda sublineata TaxID=1163346 RepID=UPI0024E100AB|nr:dual specificity mitogen-activated protein kinase kinase 7-like [Diorhabda sublineata]
MSEATSKKIDELLYRIKNEGSPSNLGMSRSGTGGLPTSRRGLSLGLNSNNGSPVMTRPRNLNFSTRQNDDLETEKKLKEIMQISGDLTIDGELYKTDIKDMEHIEELGNGTCGHVVKMRHKPSRSIIAVKQMRRSGNSDENKRIIMDIEVVLKSHDCKYIVQCLGCFITDSEVWICMELMDTCFDKLLKRFKEPIPEEVLGKVTVATVEALSYLKDKHDVMHRDVKPSNILLDTKGNVKLCDFGISGRLVDSMAKTRSAGCAAYMAPERIEPPDPKNPDYDVRADVWSLGITLVEMATGVFPYQDCKTDFEMLSKVIGQAPPSLPTDKEFSPEFRDFVACCLIKDHKQRPKYTLLKNHPFMKKYEEINNVNVGEWYVKLIKQSEEMTYRASPRQNSTTHSIRQFFTGRQPSQIQLPPSTVNSHGVSNGKISPPSHTRPASSPSDKKVPHMSRYNYFRRENPSQESLVQSSKNDTPFQLNKNNVESMKEQLENKLEQTNAGSPLVLSSNTRRLLESSSSSSNAPYRHRRVASETRWRSPSASPLPLRTQFQVEEPHYNCGNTSPIILQRFYHQQKQQQMFREAEESGKKRFASYIKLQLGGDRSGRSSRHQSPEPPPRLNRHPNADNQSPLTLRRNFLENNSLNSPSLSRRYVSPTPPVPPPRRLSESSSVPGSPQHLRARFHYTPEPQRRPFKNDEVS